MSKCTRSKIIKISLQHKSRLFTATVARSEPRSSNLIGKNTRLQQKSKLTLTRKATKAESHNHTVKPAHYRESGRSRSPDPRSQIPDPRAGTRLQILSSADGFPTIRTEGRHFRQTASHSRDVEAGFQEHRRGEGGYR